MAGGRTFDMDAAIRRWSLVATEPHREQHMKIVGCETDELCVCFHVVPTAIDNFEIGDWIVRVCVCVRLRFFIRTIRLPKKKLEYGNYIAYAVSLHCLSTIHKWLHLPGFIGLEICYRARMPSFAAAPGTFAASRIFGNFSFQPNSATHSLASGGRENYIL